MTQSKKFALVTGSVILLKINVIHPLIQVQMWSRWHRWSTCDRILSSWPPPHCNCTSARVKRSFIESWNHLLSPWCYCWGVHYSVESLNSWIDWRTSGYSGELRVSLPMSLSQFDLTYCVFQRNSLYYDCNWHRRRCCAAYVWYQCVWSHAYGAHFSPHDHRCSGHYREYWIDRRHHPIHIWLWVQFIFQV